MVPRLQVTGTCAGTLADSASPSILDRGHRLIRQGSAHDRTLPTMWPLP